MSSITNNDISVLYKLLQFLSRNPHTTISEITDSFEIRLSSYAVCKLLYALSILPFFRIEVFGKEMKFLSDKERATFDSGNYNSEPLLFQSDREHIILDAKEVRMLKQALRNDTSFEDTEYLFVGNQNKRASAAPQYDLIEKIHSILKEGKTYYCKIGEGVEIAPLGIYYAPILGEYFAYAIVGDYLDFFSFSGVSLAKTLGGNEKKHFITQKEKDIVASLLPYLWGPDRVSIQEKPSKNVLLLRNEENTEKKLFFELSMHEKNKQFDIKIIKTDDGETKITLNLIPTEDYLSWILSYGSSLIVLKPLALQKQIINIYKDVRDRHASQ